MEEKQLDKYQETPSDLAALQYESDRDEALEGAREQVHKEEHCMPFKRLSSLLHLGGNPKGDFNRILIYSYSYFRSITLIVM